MTDWQREYRNLVSALWRGYQVYNSNGSTNAQFERHVWPVIADARKRLRNGARDAPRFVYAIGYRDELGAYGMVKGPTPDLSECLDFVPDDDERVCYVLRFEGEHNQVVARWNPRARRWVERVTMTAAEAGVEA